MEFEYRLLSEERCKEIDSLNIMDPYGYGKLLYASKIPWITNNDETILFCCAFFPRHDDLEGHRISYLFFENNNYCFIDFKGFDVNDTESNGIEYRNMKIDILENEFIERSAEKEHLLSLLKDVIGNYEKKHIRSKKFNKQFVIEFTYRGETI